MIVARRFNAGIKHTNEVSPPRSGDEGVIIMAVVMRIETKARDSRCTSSYAYRANSSKACARGSRKGVRRGTTADRPGDILKTNTNEEGAGGDDAPDALRYMIATKPNILHVVKLKGF